MQQTLSAIGLDPDKLPTTVAPWYSRVSKEPTAGNAEYQSNRMALVTGQAPPFALPHSKQEPSPPAGLLSGLPSSSGYDVSQHVDKSRKSLRLISSRSSGSASWWVASHNIPRDSLPVSRAACHQAVEAMEHNAKNYSLQQWYMWYV